MPVFNGAQTVRSAIESVLVQTFGDFELLIGNDGSTDGTACMVGEFTDSRIRLLNFPHDYIATLNQLVDCVEGKYIARLDADDKMLPDRLRIQAEYMESHPEVDVCGGLTSNIGHPSWMTTGGEIGLRELCECNRLIHPTVMIRRSSLLKSGCRYDEEYKYAEDYKLWSELAIRGLRLVNLPVPLIEYGISPQQVSCRHHDRMSSLAARIMQENTHEAVARANCGYKEPEIIDRGRRLTVIITCLNEGEEFVNTVRSVRGCYGNSVDIIVVNDASVDGFDYRAALQEYDVYYLLNYERHGVARSRDRAISCSVTPYFLLLDGHMRVYDNRTPGVIAGLLDADDRRILCGQTVGLVPDTATGELVPDSEHARYSGAFMPDGINCCQPELMWIGQEIQPGSDVVSIPVVLGACYAASKRYWSRLGGLRGLECWGCDEVFISYKAWMEGGRCVLLKEHLFGHLYRQSTPYLTNNHELAYNKLLVAELLFSDRMLNLTHASLMDADFNAYRRGVKLLKQRANLLNELRESLNEIITRGFDEVRELQGALTGLTVMRYCEHIPETNGSIADAWLECVRSYRDEDMKIDAGLIAVADAEAARIPLSVSVPVNRSSYMVLAYLTARLQTEVEGDSCSTLLTSSKLLEACRFAKVVLSTPGCGKRAYFHAREFLFSINNPDSFRWMPDPADIV